MVDELSRYTTGMVDRARYARDRNGGQPELAWSTGERLTVGLILGNRAVLDAEDRTESEARSRLSGDLYFYGYPAGVDTWITAARRLLDEPGTGRERQEPPAGLLADPSITCTFIVDDGGSAGVCHEISRFAVARSDGDPSYGAKGGTEEACEGHLADAVCGMVDGDENVQAIVTLRWDRAED
jgi:hypothetical protein